MMLRMRSGKTSTEVRPAILASGDPQRVLRTLRRFDRRPVWLPVYARALAQGGDWASVDMD